MAAAPTVTRASGAGRDAAESEEGTDPSWPRAAVVGVGLACAVGVALRAYTRSELWLDEALTVNLATVPIGSMVDVLRRDGAPPLYYLLLHVWAKVLGTGDVAVRSLSAVIGVATFPVIYRAGRRLGGPVVAAGALVLLATSPFAMRYGTEARMYTLVVLLVDLGWLALANALERPTLPWLAAVGALAGALLLTHYWAFYLVGVTWLALLLLAWRRPARRAVALRVLVAMTIGCIVLFAPWAPHFLYQRAHTGTPWGTAPNPIEVAFTTLVDLGGGPYAEGQALAALITGLVVLALFGAAVDARRIEIDVRTRPGARREAAVAALTLLIAVGIGTLTASAFASRYTSVAFPLTILVAAYGLRSFADRKLVAGVLVLASVLGVVGGVRNVVYRRTSADTVAALIAANGGKPGDVVAYCPDQLGPDVSRLLPKGYEQVTFPDFGDPHFVNWVDYGERMAAADPETFGRELLARSGGRTIWYVWMSGYRTLDKRCERINDTLGNARPGNRQLMDPDKTTFERHVLWLHPAAQQP